MKTLATASLARPVQIHRFLAIHEELLKKTRRPNGPPVNCTTLAEILERTRRTIERDIECLKSDPYNLPIEFDRDSNSYRYTEDVPFFPIGANLTGEELLAMSVARQALGVFSGADFGEKLREAFDKVTGGALNDTTIGNGTPFDELISYRTPGASIAAPAVFASLLTCLLDRMVLEVDYQAKEASAPKRRTLHPYHLACIENRWILIARDVSKAGATTPFAPMWSRASPSPSGARPSLSVHPISIRRVTFPRRSARIAAKGNTSCGCVSRRSARIMCSNDAGTPPKSSSRSPVAAW